MPGVVFFFRGGRAELLERIKRGEAPREFLYGMDAFEAAGWDVSFAEAAPGDSRWIRKLVGPIERFVGKVLAASFSVSNAFVHWKKIQRADVIVSTTDGNTTPLLALKKIGLLKKPVIGITQGLYEVRERLEKQLNGSVRLPLFGSLLAQAQSFVVLGVGDEKAVRDYYGEFPLPPLEIALFGADETYWTPGAEAGAGAPILSVGTDHLRDYETLLKAAHDLPVRIVTRQKLPKDLVGSGVTVDGDVTDEGLRALYRASRFVVIPLKNAPRDSGHSVTVQAMACGKTVILSDTIGLWDRTVFRHGENCWLVPPHDAAALRAAIDHLSAHPELAATIGRNARRLIEEQWTSRHFGNTIVRLAEKTIAA